MRFSPSIVSRWGVTSLCTVLAACGQWQRVGTSAAPDPNVVVPALFDPATLYHDMGLFARGAPLPFVASLQFLAGPTADSSLAVVGLSLASKALSFQRSGQGFEAQYRVEVAFRRDGDLVAQVASDETVRVATFPETLRSDESIIFQHFARVPPGRLTATVSVRDRHAGAFNQETRDVVVPRFDDRPRVSSALLVYEGKPRGDRQATPPILINPRATTPYGVDSLQLYVEGYNLASGATADVRATNDEGVQLWQGAVPFHSAGPLDAEVLRLSPAELPVGEIHVDVALRESPDTSRSALLLSFSDRWAIANFDELLSLLRYFGHDEALRRLRDAPPQDRPKLWRDFWRATDPNPATPENEALAEYFQRLQAANVRFQEGSVPGWLTDRGEVYVTLGEPDEIYDQSSDLQGPRRFIRWTFSEYRLQLDFLDDTGFGRFRLTPSSSSDYQRVLNRLRRAE